MSDSTIEVRRTEPDDYQAIRQVFAQTGVIRGTLQLPFPSAESWRKRLNEAPAGLYSLVACMDGVVVGSLGLVVAGPSPQRRHAGEIGIAVHDDFHGRGVGTALLIAATDLADNWLALKRLELTVYADNDPAISLYRRFGFQTEGRLQNFAFRDGRYVDAYAMARLRP